MWREHDSRNWRKRVYQPIVKTVGLPAPRPYDLRGSYVSLPAAAGYTLLEVARRAGHSVDTCERYYAKIFDDVDPANRVDPRTRSASHATPDRAALRDSSTRPIAPDRDVLYVSYTPRPGGWPWIAASDTAD